MKITESILAKTRAIPLATGEEVQALQVAEEEDWKERTATIQDPMHSIAESMGEGFMGLMKKV